MLHKWYFDELYDEVFVANAKRIGKGLWQYGDVATIDGVGPNGVAKLSQRFGAFTGRLQTGYVYHYAFVMMVGLLVIVSWFTYSALMGGK